MESGKGPHAPRLAQSAIFRQIFANTSRPGGKSKRLMIASPRATRSP
jgi:hypothetical protein